MVTHTLNDAGGVPLSLIDENFKVIKRTHFLRTYPNPPYEFNIYDHTSFLEYEGPSSYIFVYTTRTDAGNIPKEDMNEQADEIIKLIRKKMPTNKVFIS